MKWIINILLLLLIAFLGYWLYSSIKEPIDFQHDMKVKKKAVIERLKDIRTSQELYRTIKGDYASSFDSLVYTLKNDKIVDIAVFGDPDDPENMDKVTRDTTYYNAIDSVTSMGIPLDSLKYVPFGKDNFVMTTDTITHQKVLVHVIEVGTPWKNFMGKYADPRFSKYDNSYDPEAMIKFGDLEEPSISGNWE